MGLINWLKSIGEAKQPEIKEQWKLVKTIKYPNGVTRGKKGATDREEGDLYFHFFESNLGNRCVQPRCTISEAETNQLIEFTNSTKTYHEKIYRWLMGRGDPDILRYDEVEQEETIHYMRGTIEEPATPENVITQ